MICGKCNNVLSDDAKSCSVCGFFLVESGNKKKKFIKLIIILLGCVVLFIGCFLLFYYGEKKNDESSEEVKKKEDLYYYFKIENREYKLGDLISNYESRGFSYKDDFYSDKNLVVSNGFISHNFYFKSKPVFYGGFTCQNSTNCSYSDSNLIKINFYHNLEDLLVGGYIKYGLSYEDVVNKLGEPDGKFYMNSDEYVWAFYEKGKIGTPYYILEFDSDNVISGIKIGLWWYDEEYEYTVK